MAIRCHRVCIAPVRGLAPISGCLWALLFWLPLSGMGAESNTWRIVPRQEIVRELELPPLAVVERRDDTGQTWQQTGTLAGELRVAHGDFKMCLERQGWRLDKVIPMGGGTQRSLLCLWRKAKQEVLVLLWEQAAGKTGFSIGKDAGDAQRGGGSAEPKKRTRATAMRGLGISPMSDRQYRGLGVEKKLGELGAWVLDAAKAFC